MRGYWTRGLLLLTAAALVPACGGSSGGGAAGAPNFVINGAGGNTISTLGGNSSSAAGGKGGGLLIQGQSGSGVHSLTGAFSIKTTFQVPGFAVNLGANPLTISASGSLTPPGTTGVVPGTNPGNATGLHVTNGAILTINADTGGGGADAHLKFPNGVLVDSGCTIQMGDVGGSSDKVNLDLAASTVVFLGGTTFLSTGNAGGGKGGDLLITCTGDIALRGDISMSGGSGGGNGGELNATSTTAVYATGGILTGGGSALVSGPGGSGGPVTFGGALSGVFCSAGIQSFGGSGVGGGGPAGSITFAATVADTIVSGNLDTTGGTGLAAGADGGDGGAITLSTNGFNIRVTGDWSCNGGPGHTPAGIGGAGGTVTILQQNKNGAGLLMPTQLVTGGMGLSVSISTQGGNGDGGGGAGGDVIISQNLDGIDATLAGLNPLTMAGYDVYNTGGGNGATTGGQAANIAINNQLFTAGPWNPGSPIPNGPQFNGSTENEVLLMASGGNGTAGIGGKGGTAQVYGGVSSSNSGDVTVVGGQGAVGAAAGGLMMVNVDLLAGGTPNLPDPQAWVRNSGQLLANGGNGTTGAGGAAGLAQIHGHAQVTQSGSILLLGGGGSGGAVGGAGGTIFIAADGTVSHTGLVTSRGGDSPVGTAGDGGSLLVNGQQVTHNGDVSMKGGDGTIGGNGGQAYFNSQFGGTVMHGDFTLAPGFGGTPTLGVLFKDGVDMPLNNFGFATY